LTWRGTKPVIFRFATMQLTRKTFPNLKIYLTTVSKEVISDNGFVKITLSIRHISIRFCVLNYSIMFLFVSWNRIGNWAVALVALYYFFLNRSILNKSTNFIGFTINLLRLVYFKLLKIYLMRTCAPVHNSSQVDKAIKLFVYYMSRLLDYSHFWVDED
jgi:hypothetical protein